MSRSKVILILVAIALPLGPGCGKPKEEPLGEARPVPSKADEAGWPVYEQPADGFALSVPPGWTALNLDPKTLDRTLEQGIRINPDLKVMEQGIRQQVAAGLKFLALERANGGPNVNVVKSPLREETSLDVAAADFLKGYDALPSVEKPIPHRRVRLPAGEAERLDYVMPVTPPGGKAIRLTMTSHVLVRARDLFIITVTSGVDEAAKYEPTFERVAQSFRFVGP
jgi:hypothetical protein